MKKLMSALDFNKNEAHNLVLAPLAAAPSAPKEGQLYFDSVTKTVYAYANGTWLPFDPAKLVAYIPLAALAVNPADRANHTATQLAATISDLAAAVRAVTSVPIGNLTVDPLARSNHTGLQLAATISNFDAQVRTSRLDQMAAPTAAISLNNQKLTNVANPTVGTDGVNKTYVDGLLQGMTIKPSAEVATVAALPANTYSNGASGVGATLTASVNGALTIDGYAVKVGDRVLVNGEATAANNGLYVVTATGGAAAAYVLTRDSALDMAAEFNGALVAIENVGQATTANRLYLCSSVVTAVGTTAVSFTYINSPTVITQGNGISISANVVTAVAAAGGGLSVSAAGIALDPAVAVRKYAAVVPAGSTATGITHNLNTLDVTVAVYEVATGDEVIVDVQRTSANVVTLTMAVAPTANQFRVVVHG